MRFVGIDVFTGKKYEDWFPGTENVEVPEIIKYDLRVINVDEKLVTGATSDGTKKIIPLPTSTGMMELVDSILEKFAEEQPIIVTVLCCIGKEGIIRVRDTKHTPTDSD